MGCRHDHNKHGRGHDHSHGHHHHGDQKLGWAAFINILLTLAQLVGGIFSGSLALIADAMHNLSDAGALVLALVARRISRRAPDDKRSYGYKKVETLAAFTNFLVLILIALWLAVEAVMRFFEPQPVAGMTVFVLALLGVIINGGTAMLVYAQAKTSQNIRAAFLHNLTDAMSSVGVMVAGLLIMAFGWSWIDPLITLAISAYIVIHAMHDLPDVINILIDGKSAELEIPEILNVVLNIDGVSSVHHVHARQLGEGMQALEAHVVLKENADLDRVKNSVKAKLLEFQIAHSTIEFEFADCAQADCT